MPVRESLAAPACHAGRREASQRLTNQKHRKATEFPSFPACEGKPPSDSPATPNDGKAMIGPRGISGAVAQSLFPRTGNES